MLAAHFWPGPLTMIFEKSDIVPYGTTGGLDTVAVRMPCRSGGPGVDQGSRRLRFRAQREYVGETQSYDGAACRGGPERGKIDMILDGGTL